MLFVIMQYLWYISPSDYIPGYFVCRYTAAIKDISNNITIARYEDALYYLLRLIALNTHVKIWRFVIIWSFF